MRESLARRLKTTALAGGALLAGASDVSGAIVTGTIDQLVGPGERFDINLDGGAGPDYFISVVSTSFTSAGGGVTSTTYVRIFGGGRILTSTGDARPRIFERSDSVSQTELDRERAIVFLTRGGERTVGEFLGLRFFTFDPETNTGSRLNGWLQVDIPGKAQIYLGDFAYETDGGPIHIPNEVPEPSTLLLMASGAAGLLALRRRRKS